MRTWDGRHFVPEDGARFLGAFPSQVADLNVFNALRIEMYLAAAIPR